MPQLGLIWIARDAEGVLAQVHLPGVQGQHGPIVDAEPLGADVHDALERYEKGDASKLLALPLVPAKTAFARAVREAMRAIPMGQIRSYGQLARALGKPGAARAVGQACGANPLPLLVPCHRVVGAHGLGGFALGFEAKRALLRLEGIDVAIFNGFR